MENVARFTAVHSFGKSQSLIFASWLSLRDVLSFTHILTDDEEETHKRFIAAHLSARASYLLVCKCLLADPQRVTVT